MRWIFWASTAVLVGVVSTGLSRNAGTKLVRVRPQEGCLWNYANVAGSQEQRPQDLICCTGGVDDEAVCVRGRVRTTKVITSKMAFVVPLLALAVNALCDWLAGGATAARSRARRNRFWLYVAVMLWRTLGLYFGLDYIQDRTQPEESSNCWYAHLRRSGRCSEHFDFADHVVLAVCQYFAIQVFELSCVLQEYWDLRRAAGTPVSYDPTASSSSLARKTSPTSSSSSASSASSRSPLRRLSPPSPLLSVVPAATVCVAVAGAALLLAHDTASFFHTTSETAVALAISWCAVGSPLMSLMGAGIGGDGGDGGGDRSGGAVGGDGRAKTGGVLSPSRGVFLAPLPSTD